MANPVLVECTKNIWIRVAADVESGQIHKMHEKPYSYLHTYRNAGDAAPDDVTDKEEGVELFIDLEKSASISSSAGIDIYIMCLVETGLVRADL